MSSIRGECLTLPKMRWKPSLPCCGSKGASACREPCSHRHQLGGCYCCEAPELPSTVPAPLDRTSDSTRVCHGRRATLRRLVGGLAPTAPRLNRTIPLPSHFC